MERIIFPWDFHSIIVYLDEESILFLTIFLLTFLIHVKLEGSLQFYLRRDLNWKKSTFTRDIFKSFLTQVSRRLSWSEFFEGLYSSNKIGNRERIRFINKFLPEFSQIPVKTRSCENEKQAEKSQCFDSVLESEIQKHSFSQKNNSKKPQSKNPAPKEQEKMSKIPRVYNGFSGLKSPNPQAQALEDFVEIKRTEERGRCLVVTKNTPRGSTLVVKKPFVASLDVFNREVISKRCYHCFQKNSGSKTTCHNCHFANFCSEHCLLAASSSYHKYECPCFPLLSDVYRHNRRTSHILAMVFRKICSLGPQKLYNLYTESKYQNENGIPLENSTSAIYESSDYKRILELHQKIDEFSDWTAPLSCLILTKILRSQSSFFTEIQNIDSDFDVEDFQEFVATLMLQHFESFIINCFSLQQPEIEDWSKSSKREDSKYESYGAAVFTTASLINHSCLPNAAFAFESRFGTIVVTSLRDLRAGEEIRISYGPTVNSENSETADERIRYLKRAYGFDCDCEGCSKGWPGLKFALEFLPLSSFETPSDVTGHRFQLRLQSPVEKLAECQDALDRIRQENPTEILSPTLLKTQDDYKHFLRVCIASGKENPNSNSTFCQIKKLF